MYKFSILILSAVLTTGLCSCHQKQNRTAEAQAPAAQTQHKTAANLKAACDGEATASAKYAAFSTKAAEEKQPQIEALFKATSKAEAIHLANHLKALKDLDGSDYTAVIAAYEVKTTAENLQAAIDGETGEFTTMYPQYIADAKADIDQNAVSSFTYAEGAEKDHAKLYTEALANLKNHAKQPSAYYVCPVCGFVYPDPPAEQCELCGTPSSEFIEFSTDH